MGQKHTLFFAAGEGRIDDLKWVLFEKRVSPNLRDHSTQEVALHLAASKGHLECVKLLLNAGILHNLSIVQVHNTCLSAFIERSYS